MKLQIVIVGLGRGRKVVGRRRGVDSRAGTARSRSFGLETAVRSATDLSVADATFEQLLIVFIVNRSGGGGRRSWTGGNRFLAAG
jgi:hypothetical protein